MKNIFFLHPGKANYPDINAYKDYFKGSFHVYDGMINDYENFQDKNNTILWCVMGFYPKKQDALYIIHDYRSLSVGRLNNLKDQIKKRFNHKPDLRIFLNERVMNKLSFSDKLPFCLLDMGVPEWIFNVNPHETISGNYCYIGEISYERKFDKLLDGFLNFHENESFILVGDAEDKILKRYKDYKNLIFTGKVPQSEALAIVKACDYAVCFIPDHEPYCYQTPTKLLEYLALDVNIIFNKSQSNLDCIKKSIMKNYSAKKIHFLENENNYLLLKKETPRSISSWNEVIKSSNIVSFICN